MFQSSLNNCIEPFTIILAHRNHSVYGNINTFSNLIFSDNIQPNHEIQFTVHKELNTSEGTARCNVWDNIKDLRYVYIPEINEYFEIHVSITDSNEIIKSVTGTSASVTELCQVNLYNIEINTENDIAREDYVIATTFYNANDEQSSLLHRIFEKAKHYTIKHVDSTLWKIQRTFSISDTSLYDFCTGTLAEEIGCLFSFDSKNRTISVYDLWNTCKECGYRGEFIDTCPECQGTNIQSGYGEDTTIFVSTSNLTDNITLDTNQEEIKNCFKVEGGDDLVTSTVVNCNPNGSGYIYYFSNEMKEDMSKELINKLESYEQLSNSHSIEYRKLMAEIYESIDKELYLTSEMMPTKEITETNATKQLALLTASSLSPIAVTDVSKVSLATSNSAILGMAKVICSTKFKIEIVSSSLSSQIWSGKFKISNNKDDEDIAISNANIVITITDNYEKYVKQKLDKMFDKDDTDGLADLLSIENYQIFVSELKKYCLNRLISFEAAFQSCMDILTEQDCGNKKEYPDLYNNLYLPYYNKLKAIQSEMKVREREIKTVQSKYEILEKRKNEIQNILDFEKYLGKELLIEFYSHRREDKYSNENYISDGLDNAKLFEMAQDLISIAKKEIKKSAEKKYTISSTLGNLLKIKEFRPLVNKFKCGNWIRIQVNDEIYKLRLLSYQLNFDDTESGNSINVTFSDISKSNDLSSDINSILSNAKSMSGSYSYVTRQANKGEEAKSSIEEMRENGLKAANTEIVNADTEDVVYGRNGMLFRSYNDITEEYDPTQMKIIHNRICITDDNWQTSKLSLGESSIDGKKYFGLFADFVNAGKVWGTDIIGGTVTGGSISGGSITGSSITGGAITGGSITGTVFNNGNGTFSVDKNGNLIANSATINGILSAKAGSKIGNFIISNNAIFNTKSSISDSLNGVYVGTDGIALGKNNSFKVTKEGYLTADIGYIARFTIGAGWLFNGVSIGESSKSCGMSAGTALGGNDDWIFWAGNGMFRVDINGQLFSNAGSVGGWQIRPDALFNDSIRTGFVNHPLSIIRLGIGGNFTYQGMLNDIANGTDYALPDIMLKTNGDIEISGEGLALRGWRMASDKRIKKDIQRLDARKCFSFINLLSPSEFRYKKNESNRMHHGFIADEVQDALRSDDWGVYCNAKNNTKLSDGSELNITNVKSLRYEEFIPDIVGSIQYIATILRENNLL